MPTCGSEGGLSPPGRRPWAAPVTMGEHLGAELSPSILLQLGVVACSKADQHFGEGLTDEVSEVPDSHEPNKSGIREEENQEKFR